jgi:hypothetical protein
LKGIRDYEASLHITDRLPKDIKKKTNKKNKKKQVHIMRVIKVFKWNTETIHKEI